MERSEIELQLQILVNKWAFQLYELASQDEWNMGPWSDRDSFWDDVHNIDKIDSEISPIKITSCLGTIIEFTFSQYAISEFDFPQNSKHK